MKKFIRKNKKIIREEKGAISALVLFTVLIFVTILGGSYIVVTSLQKSQLKSDLRIQKIYAQDVDNVDEIYKNLAEYAKYDNPYIPKGFTHTEGTWNSGYTIKETSTGNEFVWVPCVLDQSKVKEGDIVVTFGKTLPTRKEDETINTNDPYYMYNKNNRTITGDENPASDIRTSVGAYGGFYIAKYEAGVPLDSNGNEIEPTSATTTQKARSVLGANTWTNITRTNVIAVAANMVNTTDGVKSGLITGETWDTTLQWMVNVSENSANEPNTGYDTDSTENGYYEQTYKTTTGQYPINNIYDMAGNVWEWTTENCTNNDKNYAVIRGGSYNYSGSDRPAAGRYYYNDIVHNDIGFRVVLYKTEPSYDNPYIPTGFTHTQGTWNSGYTIKEKSTGNEFVWVPCVLDQSKVKEGDNVVTFGKILPTPTEDGTLDTNDKYYIYNQNNYTQIREEGTSAEEVEKSVEKYGGFYIAAYEAGIEGMTENYKLTTKTETNGTVKPLSQADKGLWNYIAREDAIIVSEAMIDEKTTGVKSALISGTAWDTTLQWMVNASTNKDNEPNLEYDIDSTGKGWYKDVLASTRHLTGYYAVNNIYDMAGNVYEWTTENCMKNGNDYLVSRGGKYENPGASVPAAFRLGSSSSMYTTNIGFRVMLYKNI